MTTVLQQLGIVVTPSIKSLATGPVPNPKTMEPVEIQVFLDGSALGNGKANAKAGYAAVFVEHPELTLAEHLSYVNGHAPTNNRAEYMALIRALEVAPPGIAMKAYTDSMLLFNTITKWIPAWKRKGWRKADGSPVMNIDLVQKLDILKTQRKLTMQHVAAHTGKQDFLSVWNDKADRLAKAAAASGSYK